MLLSKNIIFDAIIFVVFGFFDSSSKYGSLAADVDLITTNVLEDSGQQNVTVQFVAKTDLPNSNNSEFGLTTNSNKTKSHLQHKRKLRRFRGKRPRRRRIGSNSTTPSLGPTMKQKPLKYTTMAKKRNLRRRKFRKNGKKQKSDSSILEITTAKGIIISRITQSNDTINKLIEKLNKNPEDNFDEFKSKKRTGDKEILMPDGIVDPLKNITEKGNALSHRNLVYSRCKRNRGGCAHFCHPKGKIKCSCIKGFYLGEDRRSCLDIDECKSNNGQCETECINLIGSYVCKCPEGLALTDDKLSCQDVNECLLRNGHGPCQDTCINTFGSYECSCDALNGTKLGFDGHTCEDIDECLQSNGGCSHICINTLGRSFCSCPSGLELSSDWKTCQDINECQNDHVSKTCKNCLNTQGSYICLDVSDMQSDQSSSASTVCKPLFPPSYGFISCSRKGAFQSITRKGRKRTINSPGTTCKLICPAGYRIVGEYYAFCETSGEWHGKRIGKCVGASPPKLQCPKTQHVTIANGEKRVLVKFSSPTTDVHWNYVKSKPRWAKDLEGYFREGRHDITFTVKDPDSRLFSTCSFKIVVESNSV
ncbi:unnamed protein product [Psylliodes chrysocephalus]|uniref:Uncharacterized protein n=1 Tax=Psylliodes chrysocephalus TaxID=3402493 RepID=A0A9P0G5V4_9CUCU|nr:unnamed protein product [Psylliodes chrysocephala]